MILAYSGGEYPFTIAAQTQCVTSVTYGILLQRYLNRLWAQTGDCHGHSCETDTIAVRSLVQAIQEDQQVAVQVVRLRQLRNLIGREAISPQIFLSRQIDPGIRGQFVCVRFNATASQVIANDSVQAQRASSYCHEETQQDDVNEFWQVKKVINRICLVYRLPRSDPRQPVSAYRANADRNEPQCRKWRKETKGDGKACRKLNARHKPLHDG